MNLNFASPDIQAEYEKTLAMLESLHEFIDTYKEGIVIKPQSEFRTLATREGKKPNRKLATQRQKRLAEARALQMQGEIREYPPVRRTINVCGNFFTLQFPYMIFAKDGVGFYCFFAKEPITSTKTEIWYPPIPNVFPESIQCLCACAPE